MRSLAIASLVRGAQGAHALPTANTTRELKTGSFRNSSGSPTPLLAVCMAARLLEKPRFKNRENTQNFKPEAPIVASSHAFNRKTPFPKRIFLPIYHCGYGGKSTALPAAARPVSPCRTLFTSRVLRNPESIEISQTLTSTPCAKTGRFSCTSLRPARYLHAP